MRRTRKSGSGFTLIELLVVMLIIGLLAGISIVAYTGARAMIRATMSKQQLNQLTTALEQYNQKYGEYPPDGTADENAVKRHILKRWPKVLKAGTINECIAELFEADEDGKLVQKYPERALAFWLIGPDKKGFSADESDPLNLKGRPEERDSFVTPLLELSTENYDFDNKILIDKNKCMIAYFRAEKDGYEHKELCMPIIDETTKHSVAVPYMKNGKWFNSDGFQLVLAGDDGLFGIEESGESGSDHHHDEVSRDLADSSTYTNADLDNVANFTEGATLESEME